MNFYRTLFAAVAMALSICYTPGVRAESAITPLPIQEGLSGWRFSNGPEFPGAAGWMKYDGNAIILAGDFSKGGSYVSISRDVPESSAYRELRFKVRSPARQVAVRFYEKNGQAHQHFIPLSGKADELQEIALPVVGSPDHHWGGPNNGKLTSPLRIIAVVNHSSDSDRKSFETVISELRLVDREDAPRGKVAFRPVSPEKLFAAPGGRETIELLLQKRFPFSPDDLKYVYIGYDGNEVASEIGRFDEKTGILSAPTPAEIGAYELRFPALQIVAGVVVDEPFRGVPDEYFAMDSSFSWGSAPDTEEGIRSYCRILKENGIVWNRDRLSLETVEPAPGRFLLDNRFGLYREIAAEEGLKTLECFHDTPGWNGYTKRTGKLQIVWDKRDYGASFWPLDLFAAARGLHALGAYWSDTVKAMEVWNEPDIGFGNDFPPEYLIAFTKAISRRLAEQRSPIPVIGGAFASPRAFTNYYANCIRNGLLDDSDAISYHAYSCWGTDNGADFKRREAEVLKLRETELALAPHRAGIPYWITESGSPWRRGDGLDRATRKDDLRSASEIAALTAEFRALGIERFFAFQIKFYDEYLNNFGMMDRNSTPMRSMAAYFHAVRELANRAYVGDLKIPGAVRSRAFSDGKTTVALIYTGLLEDRVDELPLPKGLRIQSVSGIDGHPLTIEDGKLPMNNGAVYLSMTARDARAFLKTDTPAMKVCKLAKNFRRTPRKARPAVFQPADELRDKAYSCYGYMVKPGEEFPVSLRINNFSSEPLTVEPVLVLPNHIRAKEAGSAKVTIPARSFVPFRFSLVADDGLSGDQYASVRLEDRSGNATSIAWELKRREAKPVAALPLRQDGEQQKLTFAEAQEGWTDIPDWKLWLNSTQGKNIEAKFRVLHVPEKLQLQVLVKDAVHSCAYPAAAAWNGDSVQFAFQRRGSKGNFIPAEPFHEYTAAKCAEGERLYRNLPAPARISEGGIRFRQVAPDEWLYLIDLPASELGITKFAPGVQLGFSLLVNSNNNGPRDGYLCWGGGIAESKDPALFNQITLTGSPNQ